MHCMKREKIDRREESTLSRKEQMTMGRLRCGHHRELKNWLHKIGRAVDTVSGKCRIGEETAEHVVYDYPIIHHPRISQCNTSERSQEGSENT